MATGGRDGGLRTFLIWMYAPGYPIWTMPRASVDRIRAALGDGWKVAYLEEPGYFTGDGARSTPEALLAEIGEAEVFCGFGISREAFRAADALRWVHSGAAGVGGSLFPGMRGSDVVFTNSAGLHAEPLADYVAAVVLHFSRGLDVAASAKARGEWIHQRLAGEGSPVREVRGRTVGVVGYGGIGSAVARRCRALGMRVVATRRSPGAPPEGVDRVWPPDGLHHLLEEAEYAVVSVPETSDTVGLIGGEELDLLGEDGVLINVSRGDIVDQDALERALEEGAIRGAGLDVFHEEPLPPDHPLWGMERVVLTPHTGAVSPRFWGRETDLILENVRRYLDDRPLLNEVDKDLGY